MEDLDESISSTESEPLFIQEEEADQARILMEHRDCNKAQSGLSFTGTQLKQLALTKPYLREMDDLLKSCEGLTAASRSHFSASCKETSLTESTNSHSRDGDVMESHGREMASPQAYLFTSYIDTHMDGVGTEDQRAQGVSQGSGTITNRCGASTDNSCQSEMPLTSAGHKLSDTMVAYEGQLLGMLAMLESCMEEAGMDFEPQDCVVDASQEYVHISKNSNLCRGTTLVPFQQEKPLKLETQPMAPESWAGQHVGRSEASNGSRNKVTVSSEASGGQQNLLLNCGNIASFSEEHLEMQDKCNVKTNRNFDPQFRFSDPTIAFDRTENDTVWCEMPKTGYISTSEGTYTKRGETGIEADSTDLPAEVGNEPKTVIPDLRSGTSELVTLGSQMEEYIEEVQRLEKRRKELLAEVLELRGSKDREMAEEIHEEDTDSSTDSKVAELMNVLKREEQGRREERKREIQGLREERAEEERRIWRVNLERQGLQEELRKLKRRLFAMARDCAHSQFALSTQHREVEQLRREEEELQSLVLQLTEEVSQLRNAQKQQVMDWQVESPPQNSSQTSNTQDELTECRRHSCGDIQQYLQGGLKALEDRYEPILLALLKRRELIAGALVQAKEQAQELRAQLRPLKEEIQKLMLQRACLEEKLKLIHIQRREDMGQYKETVYCLEESSRELKTELKIQKRKTKEMEEMRDSLSKQLLLYQAAIEDHKYNGEKKT